MKGYSLVQKGYPLFKMEATMEATAEMMVEEADEEDGPGGLHRCGGGGM